MKKAQPEYSYLVVISGSKLGSLMRVKHGMTIGRSLQADFQIPDESYAWQ